MKIREMMRRKDGQKGFTLVELIVVMAILAVLAAMAVPKFGSVLSDSKYKAHNANVDMIYEAAQLYVADQGCPASNLDATNGLKALTDNNYLATGLKRPYDQGGYGCAITTTGVITVSTGKATKSSGSWSVEDTYTK